MNDESAGIHWSFWVIGIVALVWNAMGAMNFFVQMNPETLVSFPESHRVVIENRPAWATGAFAISIFGGVLGSLLLLFKRSAALTVFVVSLIGVVLTLFHAFTVPGSTFSSGAGDIVLTIALPVLVAVFLIWYSKFATIKGWLR